MRNLTMMTDLYQLTMMNGYVEFGKDNDVAVFDVFYRETNDINLCVACGLEQVIDYIVNLHFTEDDIAYLEGLNLFSKKFIEKIRNFRFTGDIYAVKEGEIVFAGEPLLTVKAPIFEAQLIETAILNILNHQTLIATKAAKIVGEAHGAKVMEFGLRRAQGPDAGIYGTRAAMVGGCSSTSNVFAAKEFRVPPAGTHAHSWVMSFQNEIDAFRAYAKMFPKNCLLLVDTYDTVRSGIPNAITVFRELRESGYEPVGIRLDSGDLAYLSKKARRMLDDAGFPDAIICASGDIDEYILASLNQQGAKIDLYGIGTKLITGLPTPALGGVYKMSELTENGVVTPKIKVSDTREKITNPAFKTIYRIYDKEGQAVADLIALRSETFDDTKPMTIFDPVDTWKRTTLTEYSMREMMTKIFDQGKLIYNSPSLKEIAEYQKARRAEFSSEHLRLVNPHRYKVDLSDALYALKTKLLQK